MKQTPLQIVKEKFGSREELAKQLAAMVDQMHGDSSKDQVKSRLMGLSNPRLLRLYAVEQTVREQYGDKAKLIDHILEVRKKAGHTADDSYRAKLETFTKARLLDVARRNYGPTVRRKKKVPAKAAESAPAAVKKVVAKKAATKRKGANKKKSAKKKG